MDLFSFLIENKAVLSGICIGFATITGVSLNIIYNKAIEGRAKKDKNASTASALAAELLYNSYHLRDLYLEIHKNKSKSYRAKEYTHIDMQVYQELLIQIGDLGSAITFMVVDTYGDIKKMKAHMDAFSEAPHKKPEHLKIILDDIQMALVKSLSCSMTLYMYSDYMTGRKWFKSIRESRIIRIERTLSGFCKFIEEINGNIDFISIDEQDDLEFRKRFKKQENRENIKKLFITVHGVFKVLSKQPEWRAQLTLRAFSYITQNTLTRFLNLEIDEYDLMSEHEYSRFLPK
ncbi:MAG: hypothetical protein ACRBDI_05395 [Alphaproteobacteria bacterium]